MACTTQSAFVYVEKARSRLLGKLKNLSVILENLRQKEVFSDEAVSKIQAEKDDYDKTRKILDWVKCKGEDACYELLRIVDMTRQRTLEVDLHHWISCFPFREDAQMDTNYLQGPKPCHRYQAKLKLKARKTSNEFWMANKYLFEENNKPDLSYMSLVLDTQGRVSPSKTKKLKSKKSKMIRPKKLRTYVPEDKVGISPGDLLKTYRDVLVVGKPGIGKTALTQEMLKLWAERDNEKLDYMFYFDMRETSHITKAVSLEDLLFNMFSEPDEGKEEVLQDIKNNSDNVTLIFDGMTDLSSSVVKRLVEKDLLPDAKIIVTCRQDDEEEFSSEDFLRVEVKGFSEQTIKAYLAEMLGKEQKKVFSNVELLTLCHVPIYALMVAACFSFETPEDSPQPCTITEIYINIVRFCLQRNSNNPKTKHLNPFIKNKRKEILSLAEAAFNATEGKTVNLTELPSEDSCVLSFLKPLFTKVGPTKTKTTHAFLHYTMQEFFAALWLLKNPDKIKDVFQQCLTEEKKHMKHLIPFMCCLLNEKSPSLTKCLIPAEELKNTSDWFFKEMITTFFTCPCEADTEDSGPDVDILFLCQCLYESQCPEACIHLLDKLGYHLDLSGESLDPLPCCAVAYVVTQSEERKVSLNLEDVRVSDQGMRRLFGCLKNVQWRDPLPLQLWKIFLLSEGQMDHLSLLGLDGNQLHLPVEGKRCLFEQAVKVMQKMSMKVNVCLHWDRETRVCQDLCESLFEALSYISSLSFRVTCRGPGLQDQKQHHGTLERKEKQLLLDLCLKAALHKGESFHNVVNTLLLLFSVNTGIHDILLDFYQHVKTGGFLSIIPLKPLFQSAPAVWVIDLSERKTSILLEVLKLQSEKKQVELRGWSDEESEVRSFLQCLPYISQLSFVPQLSEPSEEIRFLWNLFCAAAEREQQTGEKILELLSSLCSYQRFPLKNKWCDFLLDLYTHETGKCLSVLPSVQSVFQSAPAVWVIDLSERKTSILLEVLKLQSEKKQVELTGWSDEESEVRSFLQCVPYISQLSFSRRCRDSGAVKVCGNLFCAAAEREQQTGEKILELLSSLCSYQTFPLSDRFDEVDDDDKYQSDFLLDLYSHLKDYETQTGLSVLPSVQSVFQSAPAVWVIDLSERKPSILLEVLKLQSEKKQVELRGWSDEESEVRSFLQCVPYISQLSCGPEFFQRVCTLMSVRSREEAEQLASLLQLLGFTLLLTGELHLNTCRTVGRVLVLCGSDANLILTPRKISVRGASVLFRRTTRLHSLRLSNDMALLLCRWVRGGRVVCPVTVEELSLSPQRAKPSERVLLKVVSNVASLLRCWTVRRLDLTEFCVPAQGVIPLLLHDGPLTVKLSEEIFQQLLFLLHEIQDEDLTQFFLSKVGGDLTSCCVNWELLHYLLQQSSSQTFTVDLRKNSSLQRSITRLLPFLHRIVFKRLSPSFVLTAIREIYAARASPIIPSLLRSFDHVINLSCREMDSVDCAALLFTLRHSVRVKLNLLWSSIPAGQTESILFTLDRVSQLSADRSLLLRLVHCCAASDVQQGAAAVDLLRTVQHRLDLSCSSCVELDQRETLSLTAGDCRAVSAVLRHSSQDTQVILQDCEVEDSGLDLLFPVLNRVRLRASKAVLLQLVSLVPVNSERDTVRRAVSLCRALGGELDFSHSTLDQRACGALALMLDSCEELTELDLSHCRLTDQLLLMLSAHLHKVQVLDLSHNNVTDASTDTLLQLVSTNPSIHTVRLFGNKIVDRTCFDKHKFETW
ncbi:uncharacterized protein LOC125884800 isoform X14 [Epinephelus fuscoguttatus]|uniref:uncharacterized protein LOC125884800 isoform X14 n=1 Tax=Epinephelus fuscoguttatus TaxID=293821 RepID=UPI0020D1B9FC|nr:uncharacterized protein LOC125884800 isoform X14 [Epinephelus fuscoguttatus]